MYAHTLDGCAGALDGVNYINRGNGTDGRTLSILGIGYIFFLNSTIIFIGGPHFLFRPECRMGNKMRMSDWQELS